MVTTTASTPAGTYPLTITASGGGVAQTATATLVVGQSTAQNYIVSASEAGFSVALDDTNYPTPQTRLWQSGEQHTVSALSTQNDSLGNPYDFSDWSDGGAQTHTVVGGTAPSTITADYVRRVPLPSPISVVPYFGTGSAQTFTATYSDPHGASAITQALFSIKAAAPIRANQCIMRYDPGPGNLYLLADDGVALLGPIAAGGLDTLWNSQCLLSGGSNGTASGNNLSVTFAVIFTTSFAGTKQLILQALEASVTGRAVTLGTWTVPAPGSSGVEITEPGSGAQPDPILPTPSAPAPTPLVVSSPPACSDPSGTWSRSASGVGTWSLNLLQTSGSTSGNVSLVWPCGTVTWQVTPTGPSTFKATNSQVQWCQIGGSDYATPTEKDFVFAPGCATGITNETDFLPATTDQFTGQPEPPSTASYNGLQYTRQSGAPVITLVPDIVADEVYVTLADPYKTADLTVALTGTPSFGYSGGVQTVHLSPVSNAAGGTTYPIPIRRTTLPAHVSFTNVTATWGDQSFSAPAGFGTLGFTRFSQYNTPAETYCGTANTPAFVFRTDGTCNSTTATLNGAFIQQTNMNGTGAAAASYILNSANRAVTSHFLKPWSATSLASKDANGNPVFVCPVPQGGSTDLTLGNIFVAVAAVTGACNNQLSDGLSLATYPSPKTNGGWKCNPADQVLLVDGANNATWVKYVQDYCPSCADDTRGADSHIDTYTAQQACKGHSFLDLQGYYGVRLR